MPLLLLFGLDAFWLSAGERRHKQEFWDAWAQRYGGSEPPMSTYKAWYRVWVQKKIPAGEWLDSNSGGAPSGTKV